jgi:hypothetical protein
LIREGGGIKKEGLAPLLTPGYLLLDISGE